MMNGLALAGTLERLPRFLGVLEGLLAPGGQVLMDSTDLTSSGADQSWHGGEYPGDLQYQMEFEGEKGAPFPQLFVDPDTLRRVAEEEGWGVEILWRGPEGEYLARFTRR
jgi:hypothetical protein